MAEPPLSRETFYNLHVEMNKIRRPGFLDPLPYGAARLILEVLERIENTILGEAFGASEIIGVCEQCEKLLFDTDETATDESGDCVFCKECADEWRAELGIEPPPASELGAGSLGPEDNLTEQ